jgi:hypothetical protein
MKIVRNLHSKISENSDGTMTYKKSDADIDIPVVPAHMARGCFSKGFKAAHEDHSDLIPSTINVSGDDYIPVVCAPPPLNGQFISGFIHAKSDQMCLCECPVHDASDAANFAKLMIENQSVDPIDIATGKFTQAA